MRWQLAGTLIALSCLVGACNDKATPEASTAISVEAKPTKPDVIKSPAPPAGPVPIPYPNVAAESAPAKSSVKVSGKEVVLKDGSKHQKTTGD